MREFLTDKIEMTTLIFTTAMLVIAFIAGLAMYTVAYKIGRIHQKTIMEKYNMCVSICVIDHPKYNKEQCHYVCTEK